MLLWSSVAVLLLSGWPRLISSMSCQLAGWGQQHSPVLALLISFTPSHVLVVAQVPLIFYPLPPGTLVALLWGSFPSPSSSLQNSGAGEMFHFPETWCHLSSASN